MNTFELFLPLAIEHITDFKGLDHMVFLLALASTYTFKEWRSVLLVITVFTLGHTLTLMLCAFGVLKVDGDLIEFLIAATIFLTGFASLTKVGQNPRSKLKPWLAGIFGLIHGFGFSRYYGMIAEATNPWVSLPSFTLGIELGQLIIVICILVLAWLLENAFSINKRDWNLIISGGVLGISLVMMIERLPAVF